MPGVTVYGVLFLLDYVNVYLAGCVGNGFELSVVGTFKVHGVEDMPVIINDLNIAAGRGHDGRIILNFTQMTGGSILAQATHKPGRIAAVNLTNSIFRDIPELFLFYPESNFMLHDNYTASFQG